MAFRVIRVHWWSSVRDVIYLRSHWVQLRMLPSYVIEPILKYIQSTIHTHTSFQNFRANHFKLQPVRHFQHIDQFPFVLKMEIQEKPNAKETPNLKNKQAAWSNSSCRNLFRITFLRVIPLLTLITGVVVLVLGFVHGQWTDSEILRMVGVILVSFSLFWFVLGNFLNFCLNGYGQDVRDAEKEENTTSAAQTELTNEDFLVGGNWIWNLQEKSQVIDAMPCSLEMYTKCSHFEFESRRWQLRTVTDFYSCRFELIKEFFENRFRECLPNISL